MFPSAVTINGIPLGRMSLLTAICFLVMAIAFWLVLCRKALEQTMRQVTARLAMTVTLTGFVIILGYIVGAPLLYGTGQIPMALLTGIEFALLGFALALTAKPQNWVLEMFAGEQPDNSSQRYGWKLAATGILLLIIIIVCGTVNLRRSLEKARNHAQDLLTDITKTKAKELSDWYADRLGDARLITESPMFTQSISEYFASPTSDTARARVESWVNSLRKNYAYSRILLLDAKCTVQLAAPSEENWLGKVAYVKAEEALRSGKIVVSDLHLSTVKTNFPNLDVLVPMAPPGKPSIAVILLEVSAAEKLYPMVQAWPMFSATAETLLFRYEGNEIVYLNELRHRKDTALKLHLPIQQAKLIGGTALEQKTGVVEGLDYRGVPVLAAFRPVPGTPWMIEGKIDQREIYLPIRKQTGLLIIFFVAVATVVYLSLSLMWQHRNAALLRQQLVIERDRDALSARLNQVMKLANDIIILSDEQGRILDVNDRALESYGYTLAEMRQKKAWELRTPAEHAKLEEFETLIQERGWNTAETAHQRKNGTSFPIEVSIRKFEVGGKFYHLAIIRDISERKRAEASLRASEDAFRTLSLASPLGVFMTSVNGQFEYSNVRCQEIFGLPLQKIAGNGWLRAVDPNDQQRVLDEWNTAVCGPKPVELEFRVHPRPDTVRWVRLRGDIRLSPANKPNGFVGTIEDITERRQAEEALRESEEKYKRLIDTTGTGYVIIDSQGRVTDANLEYVRLTGRQRLDEILGHSVAEWTAPHDRERNEREVQKCLEEGYVRNLEIDYLTPDGRIIPIEVNATLLRTASGVHIQTLCRDNTVRKRSGEALLRVAQEWQTTFDSVSDAIWVLDANQRVVRSNKAAAEIFHCPVSQMIGKPCWETAHGTTEPIKDCPFVRARKATRFEKLEIQEGNRWFEIRVYPIVNIRGQFEGAVHIVSDITARRNIEAQLLHSQKMEAVGQLAGGVAHDFNNLLNVIIGYGELTLGKIDPSSPCFTHVSQMKQAGERAARLTRQLLAFSRKQIIEPKILDLNSVVTDLYKMLRRLVREDIDIILTLAPSLDRIKADPTQIEQVITNMAVNARDAMPQGGTLTIETHNATLDQEYVRTHPETKPGQYVELVIRDTGIGMTDEIKARIFEPFFTTKEIGKGTGLGLATCYGAIQQNNGHIVVESTVGKGTAFHVYLPRIDSQEGGVSTEETITTLQRGHETILLVEDDSVVREMAKTMLTELGYHVYDAGDGETALHIARAKGGNIHLLLTDVVMPKMSGKELADKLRKQYPHIKTLFVSGYTTDAIVKDGVLEPGVAFLQKPYFSFALASKIREVLNS